MLAVWNNNLPVRLLLNESPGSYALRMHHLELGYLLTLEMISGILWSFRCRGSWGVGGGGEAGPCRYPDHVWLCCDIRS